MLSNLKVKIIKAAGELRSIAFYVFLALFIRWGFAEAYVIPSESMQPTLQVNDRILVNKLVYGVRIPFSKVWLTHFNDVNRGDVIVFKYPKDESIYYVKRVIGLAGDEVASDEDGRIFVNGSAIDETNYETKLNPSHPSILRNFGPLKVPEGKLFVMGDNRDNSSDSRFWGFVPDENIIGKALLKWYGNVH